MSAPQPTKPTSASRRQVAFLRIRLGPVGTGLSAQTSDIANLFVTPFPVRAQDIDANVDALIANEHLRPGDQCGNGMLALAAKGTARFSLFGHCDPLGPAWF